MQKLNLPLPSVTFASRSDSIFTRDEIMTEDPVDDFEAQSDPEETEGKGRDPDSMIVEDLEDFRADLGDSESDLETEMEMQVEDIGPAEEMVGEEESMTDVQGTEDMEQVGVLKV